MRRTEFDRLVDGEFGGAFAGWIADTHVISALGDTAHNLIARGQDLREVWEGLCADFDVPAERLLGEDIQGT